MTDRDINNPIPEAGENGPAQHAPESTEAKHRNSNLLLDELTAEIAKQKSVLASSQTKRSPALFVFGRHILGSIAVLLVISYVCFVCLRPAGLLISAGADLENVFQAELPSSSTNVHVRTESAMTLVIRGRFECANADLGKFLRASALLPDELEDGINPVAPIQAHDLPWWQPASLRDTSGVECAWEAGSDVAN